MRGPPNIVRFIIQELHQIATVNTGEKLPQDSAEGGERRHSEICQSTLVSLAGSSGKLVNQTLNCWVVLEPKWPQERKSPMPTGFSQPVPPVGGGEKTFLKHLWNAQSRTLSLPTHLTTTSLKAYSCQLLLPGRSHPALKKKVQGIAKVKRKTNKNSYKRKSNH